MPVNVISINHDLTDINAYNKINFKNNNIQMGSGWFIGWKLDLINLVSCVDIMKKALVKMPKTKKIKITH